MRKDRSSEEVEGLLHNSPLKNELKTSLSFKHYISKVKVFLSGIVGSILKLNPLVSAELDALLSETIIEELDKKRKTELLRFYLLLEFIGLFFVVIGTVPELLQGDIWDNIPYLLADFLLLFVLFICYKRLNSSFETVRLLFLCSATFMVLVLEFIDPYFLVVQGSLDILALAIVATALLSSNTAIIYLLVTGFSEISLLFYHIITHAFDNQAATQTYVNALNIIIIGLLNIGVATPITMFTALYPFSQSAKLLKRQNQLLRFQRDNAVKARIELHDALTELDYAYSQLDQKSRTNGKRDRRVLLAVRQQVIQRANAIHDGPLQNFKLMSDSLSTLLANERKEPVGPELLAYLRDMLVATDSELRELLSSWYITSVRDGLKLALEALKLKYEKIGNLTVELNIAIGSKRYDEVLEDTIFGVAQEALTNTLKHAKAHQVKVTLWEEAESICLSVCDDGIGFSEDVTTLIQNKTKANRLGLLSRRDDIEILGGDFTVKSQTGQGTEVKVVLPLNDEVLPIESFSVLPPLPSDLNVNFQPENGTALEN